jgi:hypothetical protein
MNKQKTFLDTPEWTSIVNNIKGIMTSDGTMATLLDFERVLDEADVYAYKNWKLGELVDGPEVKRYDVTCTFMWPDDLMPDPRAGKRLVNVGCKVKFKKTKVEVPIQLKNPSDFKPGTHYPKLIERNIWLVNITIPKQLMNDIKEGSVDIADQTIELEDLEKSYEKDYDKADVQKDGQEQQADQGLGGGLPPLGGAPGGGLPPAPGGL